MAPDRKALNGMRKLSEVQDLRVHVAAGHLGTAQRRSQSAKSVWQDAANREAAVRDAFALMLKSGGFACGAYTTTLDLLNAHSAETQAQLEHMREAEAAETSSISAYRITDAQAILVHETITSMSKELRIRAAEKWELDARDLHNMRQLREAL